MQEMGAPRSLKERQRQEREEIILQIAEEILLEKGYHEMAMDDIASRVGIAKGTLYLHFSRKEELVFALLGRELHAILQDIEQAREMISTARAKLEFILNAIHLGILGRRGRLLYLLFNAIDLRPVVLENHGELIKKVEQIISQIIDEGKERGEFDTAMPTALMVSIFFSMIISSKAYKKLVVEGQMENEQIIRCVGQIYFRGIAAQPVISTNDPDKNIRHPEQNNKEF